LQCEVYVQAEPFCYSLPALNNEHHLGTLLPDGRKFGQITYKRPPKKCPSQEKIGRRKITKLAISGRKKVGQYNGNNFSRNWWLSSVIQATERQEHGVV
jgi:hypothetical protein